MDTKRIIIILLLVGLSFASCSGPGRLGPEAYLKYIDDPENGCVVSRRFDAVEFSARYEPADYKALKDLGTMDSALTATNVAAYKKELASQVYFVFRIAAPDNSRSPFRALAKNADDYAKLMQYMQTMMQQDFYLESGDQKIPCTLFHAESDYNAVNYTLISLAFDATKVDTSKDLTLVYNDQVFQNGLLKFLISIQTQTHLPQLAL